MMRLFMMALAVAIGALLVTVLLTARPLSPGQSGDAPALTLEVPSDADLPADNAEKAPPSPVQTSATRDVGGGLVPAPVAAGAKLERIAALPQPTPPPGPKPPEPLKPKNIERWRVVYNSVITAAGIFELNGTVMVLPDIDVVASDEICTAPNGVGWPCGTVARTELRNFVRGRAVTCKIPDDPPQESIVADCRLQGRDLADWLVERGWARAKPGTELAEKEQAARNATLGIFGNPPPGIGQVGGGMTAGSAPEGPAQPAAQ